MSYQIKDYPELEKILHQRAAKLKRLGNGHLKLPRMSFRGQIKSRELSDFIRQLATMIKARLPLTRSLEVLAAQNQNANFKSLIEDILVQVKGGQSLAKSLEAHRKIFGDLFISMVDVGEIAGILDLTLNRLAVHLEKMGSLRRKLLTAMTYPAVIVLVAVGAITFLLVAIVPTFADMFQDFGAQLPAPTRMVISIAEFLKSYGLLVITGLLLLFFLGKQLTQNEPGKYIRDSLLLKVPLLGNLLKKTFISRFCRTLGTLLESGVSLLEALDVTAKLSGNKVIEKSVLQMKAYAVQGRSLAEPLVDSYLFPPMVVQMINVGEETAELDTMLYKIADFFDEEIDATIEALTSIIEPVIIVLLGVILGGTLVAMYLQLFNLMDVIR